MSCGDKVRWWLVLHWLCDRQQRGSIWYVVISRLKALTNKCALLKNVLGGINIFKHLAGCRVLCIHRPSIQRLPPDYIVCMLEGLTTLFHYCLVDSANPVSIGQPAPASTNIPVETPSAGQILSNLIHVFNPVMSEKVFNHLHHQDITIIVMKSSITMLIIKLFYSRLSEFTGAPNSLLLFH